jgi:8-oxo-dGTP pyrophosphatase MutT (NUDIX family)
MQYTSDLIDTIQKKFSNPLPGRAAQYRMAHIGRDYPTPDFSKARKAAVILLLYPDIKGETQLVLIQRMIHPKDRHSGQISLPGGKIEPTDHSPKAAALRELKEELGVPTDLVTVLGQLSDLHISVSNFLVYPFLGVVDKRPNFIPQPSEVHAIVETPVKVFFERSMRRKKDLKLSNGITLKRVPYFDIQGHTVWGATAMIINEFSELLMEKILSPES